MVKKIYCRVINSVPFKETDGGFSSVRQPNNHQFEMSGVPVENIKLRHNRNVTNDNLKAFNIGAGILSDLPTGQILDYYA